MPHLGNYSQLLVTLSGRRETVQRRCHRWRERDKKEVENSEQHEDLNQTYALSVSLTCTHQMVGTSHIHPNPIMLQR